MKSYIQVVATPTTDTVGTTLYLHFDSKRYLIGSLTEGVQRACMQSGTRLAKVSEYLIAGRTEWQNNGGLLGMMLTLADVLKNAQKEKEVAKGKPANDGSPNSFNIISAPNLNYHVATARRFIFRKGMPIRIHEVDHKTPSTTEPFWQDENIRVWALPIMPGSARPVNPRKRSFEMLQDDDTRTYDTLEDDDDGAPPQRPRSRSTSPARDPRTEDQCKAAVRDVVEDMFNSTWTPDALFETRLADVNMPATIFVRDKETNAIQRYTGPKPGGSSPLPDPDLEVLVRRPWPGATKEGLPACKPALEAVSYIVRNHPHRGTFFPQKAKELGVQSGPAFRLLAEGKTVTTAAGVEVRPEQVLGPNRPGNGFAFISIPDQRYIDELVARPEWHNAEIMAGVDAFVWSCGDGVVGDQRVQTFMASLPNIKHVISTAEHCSNYPTFTSSAASNARLHTVDSKRFRQLVHEDGTVQKLHVPGANTTIAQSGLRVELEPAVEINPEYTSRPFNLKHILQHTISEDVRTKSAAALRAVEAAKEDLEAWAQQVPGKDVEITTLGTGSALPSKYRNVSSTLLRVPGWGSLLFDAGENTLAQMRRVFPPEELKEVLSSLKAIVISHMHADHHLGMASVIKAWYQEVHKLTPAMYAPSFDLKDRFKQKRLAVLAEVSMHQWLHEYAQIEDLGYSHLAPIVLYPQQKDGTPTMMKWFYDAQVGHRARQNTGLISPELLGLADVQAVRVNHCHGAKAVSITWPDGFKASYSGDCRPSKEFAEIGRGSTVCIHEATFDDELQGDALAKQHSTTSEALSVAQAMNAQACILTHFSQRYQKIPILERSEEAVLDSVVDRLEGDDQDDVAEVPVDAAVEAKGSYSPMVHDTAPEGFKFKLTSNMKVGVAFDYMTVKVGEICELQYFTPALLSLFADENRISAEEEANAQAAPTKKENKKSKRRN